MRSSGLMKEDWGSWGRRFAKGGATTMGYQIYFRSPVDSVTLVHEAVHIWQFQFGGTHYIGQSAFYQFGHWFGGKDPYNWFTEIGSDVNGWYLMESTEAQAEFVEDAYNFGTFKFDGGVLASNGAFFLQRDDGSNEFIYGIDANGNETTNPANGALDFTDAANMAWAILRLA